VNTGLGRGALNNPTIVPLHPDTSSEPMSERMSCGVRSAGCLFLTGEAARSFVDKSVMMPT
jgi:hypothetical protein